jgi:3-oxoacyl-[acyl-carrier protein] reductase
MGGIELMELGLEGKVAWVTGASAGLGRAAARSLSAEGATVAISARGEEALRTTAEEISAATGSACKAFPLDVGDGEAVRTTATAIRKELGPLDVVLVNSGGPPPGTFDTLSDEDLDRGLAITTRAAWTMTRVALEDMMERGGCLLYIVSWSAKEVIPGLLLSNMLRPSVVGFAKTISKEYGGRGIRTVCIAPGRIETDRLKELDRISSEKSGRSVAEVRAAAHETIPLGRYGRPEEIGDAIAFLASDRASYLTGATVLVDGGLLDGLLS